MHAAARSAFPAGSAGLLFCGVPNHLVQGAQRIGKAADLIDEAAFDCLLPADHGAHIGGHLIGGHHQALKHIGRNAGMAGDKSRDTLLDRAEIGVSLGEAITVPLMRTG